MKNTKVIYLRINRNLSDRIATLASKLNQSMTDLMEEMLEIQSAFLIKESMLDKRSEYVRLLIQKIKLDSRLRKQAQELDAYDAISSYRTVTGKEFEDLTVKELTKLSIDDLHSISRGTGLLEAQLPPKDKEEDNASIWENAL